MKQVIFILGALFLTALQVQASPYNGYETSMQTRDKNAAQQIHSRITLFKSGPGTAQSAMQSLAGTMGGMQGLSPSQDAKVRRWQMDTMQALQEKKTVIR